MVRRANGRWWAPLFALVGALYVALFLAAAACNWFWSENPLLFVSWEGVPESPACDGHLELLRFDHLMGSSTEVATALAHADCVEGFPREEWESYYLHCPVTGQVSTLVRTVKQGAERDELQRHCRRYVDVSHQPPIIRPGPAPNP
jgi:hypothetical protein